MGAIQELAGRLATVIINPLLALIFGAGLLLFIWGLVKYLYIANIKGKPDDEAKMHMVWGLVGMFVMVAVFALIRIVANTVNAQLPAGY
jgi:uncharacterized membrane protein YidH (DUF202 family)